MGSAAFILAEYTGTPYREVVYAALIPAFLYYIGVFVQVHLRAVRRDLRPYTGEIPRLTRTFALGWPFLVPIAVIVGMLMAGYSPVMTAGAGALGVGEIAAPAGVRRGDQQKPAWIAHMRIGAGDGDVAGFDWLAQGFQNGTGIFWELVHEQDTVVGKRNLPWLGALAPAHDGGH